MKKRNLMSLLLALLFFGWNVKADMGPPYVSEYEIIVTNKDGASCYTFNDNSYTYKKTDKKVSYGTVYKVYIDNQDNYIKIEDDECYYLKSSDVASKKDSLSVNSNGVNKIQEVKAIILAKGGLNLRKGPSVVYSRITTIPQYSVVKLTHSAGTYWYYATYNNKSGWITGMKQYFGLEKDQILYSYKDVVIYDKDYQKKLGTIPALTEITNYLELISYDDFLYYVNYNGIKGYIMEMTSKVNGKIKLLNNFNVYNNDKVIGTVKSGSVLEYTIDELSEKADSNGLYTEHTFYVPSLNGVLHLRDDIQNFEYVKETKYERKKTGYIGEGLYGEAKTIEVNDDSSVIENVQEPEKEVPSKINTETLIIIILGSIILILTIIITIMLIKRKQKPLDKKLQDQTFSEDQKIEK